jgi:M3 family oligoendopeptidase
MTIHLNDIAVVTPSTASLATGHAAVELLLDQDKRDEALALWETHRRDYATWATMTQFRFQQDTTNEAAAALRELADALGPVAIGHDTAIKTKLLADPDRAWLQAAVSPYVVRLWEMDVTTFSPAIAALLEEENSLAGAYTRLAASARFEIDGQVLNLSNIAPYVQNLDRGVRHATARLADEFFAANSAAFDDIYDRLVKVRTAIAQGLGFESFTPLGYRRMRRTDYGAADVARYRDEIVATVVPLLADILERRRAAQGWETLQSWDEPLMDPLGNPAPQGDHDTLVAAGQEMFDRMDPRLGDFFRMMAAGGFMDLKTRPSKAPGGFCDALPSAGMPVIFANFNGTYDDISVFTHEMGHAVQFYESRNLRPYDVLTPTMEAAEVHSMALEMLTYPHMGLLVGEDTVARFQRMHLETFLSLLVGCALGDHFQHEVYAHPDASLAERHAMYRALERRYMPWRDYGDIGYAAGGGSWQSLLHYYEVPFYLIDYALAICCALQFWVAARRDPRAALDSYLELCARGGSAPFKELVESAGLMSPFAPGALAAVVDEAAAILQGSGAANQAASSDAQDENIGQG